jgi:hypothetical protein
MVNLNWSPSTDENVVGYHVYYSENRTGPFQQLTEAPINNTVYSHSVPSAGTYHYMVRAMKLERTGSGTFHNLSQGAFTTITTSAGPTPPNVAITLEDGEVSESGPNSGVFKISRSTADANPLTVEFLIGGTAQNGVDYTTIGSSVTIPSGSTEALLTITPVTDVLDEADETVTIQLRPMSAYTIGNPSSGVLRIANRAQPQNQPPTISTIADQSIRANSHTGDLSFTVGDADTPLENLTLRGLSSNPELVPASGILFGGAGRSRTVRVVPAAGKSGAGSITLFVSDGALETGSSFILNVAPVNSPPQAHAQTVQTRGNPSISIVLTGSDPEGSPLTYVIKTQPSQGVLSGTPPLVTYTPRAGFSGSDGFSFTVSDGQLESAPESVTINVIAANREPAAVAQNLQGLEDSPLTIVLSGTDADNDLLTFELVAGPAHGLLTGRDRNYQYSPQPGFFGQDSFSFRVSDGAAVSAPAVVTIDVQPTNDPPVATGGTVQLLEDEPTTITLNASDPDRDVLTYQVISLPTKGQISGSAPNLTFSPRENANGADLMTFRVSDGKAESAVATIAIQITPVNDPPVALPQTISVVEDESATFPIDWQDADGDALTHRIISPPVRGEIVATAAGLTYTPSPNFNGSDSVTLVLNDGKADSAPATVAINIEPRNDPPQIGSVPLQVVPKNAAAGPYFFHVSDVDRPINELGVSVESSNIALVPPHGITVSGTGTNRTITILPERNVTGSSIITLRASDGVATAQSSFLFTVTNSPPVANIDGIRGFAGALQLPAAELLKNDTDPDGDVLGVVSVSPSQLGKTVGLTNGTVFYSGGSAGQQDSFTYTIEDSSGGQSSATVQVFFELQPRIDSINLAAEGRIILKVSGPASSSFRVAASTDASAWAPLGEAATGPDGRGEYQDDTASGVRHRFYRAEWPQQ